MKRVLAFFGAFNPPTRAHLELADCACRAAGREGVLFVPSQSAYIRNDQGKDFAFSDGERLDMLRSLARTRPWMEVTDIEMGMASQPRTYTTLCALRGAGWEPALLIGSDKLAELERAWLHVPEIAREFGIVCMARGQDACEAMIRESPFLTAISDRIQIVRTPDEYRAVSSTAVRAELRQLRQSVCKLRATVPEELLPGLLQITGINDH